MTRQVGCADVRRREEGATAIELVGYVFLSMLVTVLCVQGIIAVQANSAAQEAARNGARAMSLDQDWRQVVDKTLPDWVETQAVDGSAHDGTARVRVAVNVPIGLSAMTTDLTFDRTAELPIEEEPWR